MSYVPRAAVLGLAALPMFAGSLRAADRQYQMHFLAVSCFIGPCPDWQVTDAQTGEKFVAVVDFTQIASPPSSSNDLLVEARRVVRERPKGGGSYVVLAVTKITEAVPSIPGRRQ